MSNLTGRLAIAGCLVVLVVSGCASIQPASTRGKSAPEQGAAPAHDSSPSQPANSPPTAPSPPTASSPLPVESNAPSRTPDTAPLVAAPPEKPETTSSTTKSKSTAGVRPKSQPVPAPPPISATPVVKPVNSPATATLDLGELEARLRDTHAIGVFTKLSLKNQVDDLLDEFRVFYRASNKSPTAELRRHYDVLLVKVLGLLRDGDPPLAAAVSSSREAIWGILADPDKFAKL
jgi:hypothetical protein